MRYTIRDLQARVAALGHWPGPIDGVTGPRTRAAVVAAMEEFGAANERGLFHASGIHRIHGHWTAGAYGVIDFERARYNGLIDQTGGRHAGRWSAEDQANYRAGVRGASHTLNANTGALGIAMDAMAGAQERPFRSGSAPLTWAQVDAYAEWVAELAVAHWIPVTRWSVLTHAEVQPSLGIAQNRKWDVCWLPDMERSGDPIEVGDRLRALISEKAGRFDRRRAA